MAGKGWWQTIDLAGHCFQALNLDHPEVEARVMRDMHAGIDVYYDRRWACTARLCRFLLENPAWVANRMVLVLGAGVGLETLVIGRLCRTLYINDLAPQALALCAEQLGQNGLRNFLTLPGHYETLDLPPVDLIVGSFLVYNQGTAAAMQQFLARPTPPVLLVNDNMAPLRKLLRETVRTVTNLLPADETPCLLFA
jgi:predicted nicotinamide N-methyase